MVSLILQDSKSYLRMILQSRLKIQCENNCLLMAPMEWCPNKHRYLQCLLVCQELITKKINLLSTQILLSYQNIPPQHINRTNGDVHRNFIFHCLIYDVGTQFESNMKTVISSFNHKSWLQLIKQCYLLMWSGQKMLSFVSNENNAGLFLQRIKRTTSRQEPSRTDSVFVKR